MLKISSDKSKGEFQCQKMVYWNGEGKTTIIWIKYLLISFY